ncbi:MAG: hypothetical protein WDM78_02940 [Puia sp.]
MIGDDDVPGSVNIYSLRMIQLVVARTASIAAGYRSANRIKFSGCRNRVYDIAIACPFNFGNIICCRDGQYPLRGKYR